MQIMGKPPERTKPEDFSEHYLNIYKRVSFMEMLESLGFDVVTDELVEVGGYFGRYELIIARRSRVERSILEE